MIHNQRYNVYIASCTDDGGIYQYSLHDDGVLELVNKTRLDRPMYMTANNGKMYVVLRAPFEYSNESGVVSFDIADDGSLINMSECQSTMGEVACHIMADGDDIYCANYISGSVIKLPGTLVKHEGKGPNAIRQDSAHTHFVGLTPDNKYVCAVDLGVDTIFVYNKDMTLKSKAKVPDGHGARHIIFSKDGKYMFCANELESTLSVFSYNDGELTLLDTEKALPDDTQSTAAAIRIYNDKIYVSNRGHNSVSVFTFSDNKLNLETTIPCLGDSPRDFDFINDFMICTNENSDNVTIFDCKDNFRHTCTITIEKPLNVI